MSSVSNELLNPRSGMTELCRVTTGICPGAWGLQKTTRAGGRAAPCQQDLPAPGPSDTDALGEGRRGGWGAASGQGAGPRDWCWASHAMAGARCKGTATLTHKWRVVAAPSHDMQPGNVLAV